MKNDADDRETEVRHHEPDNSSTAQRLQQAQAWVSENLEISTVQKEKLVECLESIFHKNEEERRKLQAENRQLEREASLDPLTRLLNYQRFKKKLHRLYSSTHALPGIYALVMVDVNRFKAINDTFGHKMGDQVIRRVSKILRQETRLGNPQKRRGIRREDIICRRSGDEFLILLSDLHSSEDAFTVTSRYCHAFATVAWEAEHKLWRKGLRKLADPTTYRGPSLAVGILILNFAPAKSPAVRNLRADVLLERPFTIVEERMYASKAYQNEFSKTRIFSWRMEFHRGKLERILSHTLTLGEGENARSIPLFQETHDP